MRYGPPFKYAFRPDGRRIAYQVAGDGDLDLVFLFGWPTHLGLMWENPSFAGFLHKLSSFSRLILFDRSGGGLSDRGIGGVVFEDEMDDVRAVMAAVGSERAALFGCHTGGRLALLMAATYPDQVSGVVTFGSHPATLRDEDYPWGTTVEEHEGLLAMMKAGGSSTTAPGSWRWWRRGRPPTPPLPTGSGYSSSRRPRSPSSTRGSGRSARWTSADCSVRSRPPCWCCTGPATGRPTSGPAATWPSASPAPGSWSCRATPTSRSSATRTPSSSWPRSS
jgi:pimeloyl-ACP methyl ester carboxylesterase